jgi:hypothetical protein
MPRVAVILLALLTVAGCSGHTAAPTAEPSPPASRSTAAPSGGSQGGLPGDAAGNSAQGGLPGGVAGGSARNGSPGDAAGGRAQGEPVEPLPQHAAPGAPQARAQAAVPTAEPSGGRPGTRTCALLGAAITQATLMDPGVITLIVAASATADAPVADAAQRLAAAYAKAARSKGTAAEPDAVAAVSAAAADMDGVCDESGLESAG